jgi:hypothetical protein
MCTSLVVGLAALAIADAPTRAVTARKLVQRINNERPVADVPLKDVLKSFGNRHKLKFTIDEAAFKAIKAKDPGGREVDLPKYIGVRRDVVLTLLLRQIGAAYEVDDLGRIVVVPGKPRALTAYLPAAAPEVKAALKKMANIEKPIDGAPFKDVIEYLGDRYALTILIDRVGFTQQDATKYVEEAQVKLDVVKDVPLEKVLTMLAKQVRGIVIAADNFIIIVPGEET